jgi:hypothetical protein
MDKLGESLKFLDKDVEKQRKGLMKTLEWDVKEVK